MRRTCFQLALAAAVVGAAALTFVACGSSEDAGTTPIGAGGNTADAKPDKITPGTETGPDAVETGPITTDSGPDAIEEPVETDTGADVMPDKVEPVDAADASDAADVISEPVPDVVEDTKYEAGPLPEAGVPTKLASIINAPTKILQDQASLYLATQVPDVMTIHKDGTGAQTLANKDAGVSTMIGSISVDDNYVYWTNWAPGGVVRRVPKAGGAVEDIGQGVNVNGVSNDTTHVYWAEQGNTNSSDGKIVRRKKDLSAAAETVKTGLDQPYKILVDDTSIYWSQSAAGLFRMLKDGSGQIQFSAKAVKDFVLYGSTIYWAEKTEFKKQDKNGSGTAVSMYTVPTPQSSPNGKSLSIAADQTGLYLGSSESPGGNQAQYYYGKILFVPLSGGTASTLCYVDNICSDPITMVADGKSLYWGNAGAGASAFIGIATITH